MGANLEERIHLTVHEKRFKHLQTNVAILVVIKEPVTIRQPIIVEERARPSLIIWKRAATFFVWLRMTANPVGWALVNLAKLVPPLRAP
jgi:hypothetical protein